MWSHVKLSNTHVRIPEECTCVPCVAEKFVRCSLQIAHSLRQRKPCFHIFNMGCRRYLGVLSHREISEKTVFPTFCECIVFASYCILRTRKRGLRDHSSVISFYHSFCLFQPLSLYIYYSLSFPTFAPFFLSLCVYTYTRLWIIRFVYRLCTSVCVSLIVSLPCAFLNEHFSPPSKARALSSRNARGRACFRGARGFECD